MPFAAVNTDALVLESLFGVIRRQWQTVLLLVAVSIGLGWIYAELQPRLYRSAATVMVRSGPAIKGDFERPATITPEEEGLFLSQLEIIKSGDVARRVAEKLTLADDAEFLRDPAKAADGKKSPVDNSDLMDDRIVQALKSGVSVSRIGRTYVANIAFTHRSPKLAAEIAQGFAEAFRDSLAAAHKQDTQAMAAWYENEINRALTSEEAAAKAVKAATAAGQTTDDSAVEALVRQARQQVREREALQDAYLKDMEDRILPTTDAVILSEAKPAGQPISPRKGFILIVAGILGAALGAAWGGLREFADRSIRSPRQVSQQLGLRFLGSLPLTSVKRNVQQQTPDRTASIQSDAQSRLSVTDPYAPFGETARSIHVAARKAAGGNSAVVIGVVSAVKGEGKTLLAANLAAHLAGQGRKVLLVDGDLRGQAASRWLTPGAKTGLADNLLEEKPLGETVILDQTSGLSILPAGLNGRVVEPAGLLIGEAMEKLLRNARTGHDFIIIDLPALAAAADAEAVSGLADCFVMVTAWGRTDATVIIEALANAPGVRARLLGVVLNRVNLKKLALYR